MILSAVEEFLPLIGKRYSYILKYFLSIYLSIYLSMSSGIFISITSFIYSSLISINSTIYLYIYLSIYLSLLMLPKIIKSLFKESNIFFFIFFRWKSICMYMYFLIVVYNCCFRIQWKIFQIIMIWFLFTENLFIF